ncbi:hypothetical protein [Alkalilimnicola ehrlichii]|nr:hypothetical protein [Alkalilimnicola ehrlichii]
MSRKLTWEDVEHGRARIVTRGGWTFAERVPVGTQYRIPPAREKREGKR